MSASGISLWVRCHCSLGIYVWPDSVCATESGHLLVLWCCGANMMGTRYWVGSRLVHRLVLGWYIGSY